MLDLELIITRMGDQTTAALRVELPIRRAELADGEPLALDAVALRALSLQFDAYGAALCLVALDALRPWSRDSEPTDPNGATLR